MIWTLAFWKGTAERAIKTFAQALVVVVGAGGVGFLDIDWTQQLSVAGLTALASVLTSIGNASFVAGTPDTTVATVADVPVDEIPADEEDITDDGADLAEAETDDTPGKHAADVPAE